MTKPKGTGRGGGAKDKETGKMVLPSKTNGFDPETIKGIVDEVELAQAEIDQIMKEAQAKCAPLREEITDIKKTANEEHGIPRKELNAVLQERRLLMKADGVRNKLSPEQQDPFDNLKLALGMLGQTPLGQAALAAADSATAH